MHTKTLMIAGFTAPVLVNGQHAVPGDLARVAQTLRRWECA